MTLLTVERLEARHGLLTAVRGVSFAVDKGETIALVGANGAGKTTLLRAIAGQHPLAGGRVVFNDADVTPRSAHARSRMGIALVPEGRRLFASLTVEENLLLARSAGRAGRWTLEAVMAAFDGPAIARAGTGVCYGYFERCEAAAAFMAGAVQRGWKTVLEFAPQDWRKTADLWPSPGGDLELMRKVKTLFDPESVLNRGRLFSRI